MKKCKCGCGGSVAKNRIYLHGHNHKGKTYEDIYGDAANKQKEKRSVAVQGISRPDMMGDNNCSKRPDIRQKIKDGVKKSWATPSGEERRKAMKEYGAAYMNSFVKNPSKPQIELYNMVLYMCPYAVLNYPSLKYSIDIAIPFLNVAIEYDEPYWHQDKDRDTQRQQELEREGWMFCRITPTTKNIKQKIRKVVLT